MKPAMSFTVLFLFLYIAVITLGFCNGNSNHTYLKGCIETERQALLRFKRDLNDSSNRLASWLTGDGDCCSWAGVLCDNITGHVLEINLSNFKEFPNEAGYDMYDPYDPYEAFERSTLGGKLNPSLVELQQLIHLDLSYNDFQMIKIPKFLGSMRNLRYLNLSRAVFGGIIPHQLGNLSNLQYLDLSSNDFSVKNLGWLSGLSLLKHLDLSSVNVSQASDWFPVTNTLPSLVVLKLSNCQLTDHLPPLPIANFSSLTSLDLSDNHFEISFISRWVFGLSRLVSLDLSYNNLQGQIPDEVQNLTSLRHLDLSHNHFNDSISRAGWYKFSCLEYLSLAQNSLEFYFRIWQIVNCLIS